MREAPVAVVAGDALDAWDFERVLAGSDRLRGLRERGVRVLFDFEALLRDLFFAAVKLNVSLVPRAQVPASALLRRRLVDEVVGSTLFEALRERSRLSPARAGLVALELGEEILVRLKRGELMTARELGERQALAELEADEARREAEEASREALLEALEGHEEAVDALGELADEGDEDDDGERDRLEEAARRAVDGIPESGIAGVRDRVSAAASRMAAAEEGAAAVVGGGGDGDVDALALEAEVAQAPGVKRLMRVLGALRDEARAARRERVPRARTEVFGVERSDDVMRMLGSESVLLTRPALKRAFRWRFAERELATYRLRGDDHRGRGPMVILLDVSGSMAGPKIVWAKALVLAMADIARREKRRAVVLCFSSGAEPVEFEVAGIGSGAGRWDRAGFVGVLGVRAAGGTDFVGPLRRGIALLEADRDLRGGDLVIVTDGESRMSAGEVDVIRSEATRLQAQVMGITVDVGEAAMETLEAVCDTVVRVSDLTRASARSVFRLLS